MQTHVTMSGEVLDLSGLSNEQRAYYGRCIAAYRAGTPRADFIRLVTGPENPLLRETGGWITEAVWRHPLYRAVRDIENRLGVAEGDLQPDPGDNPTRDPLTDGAPLTPRQPHARAVRSRE